VLLTVNARGATCTYYLLHSLRVKLDSIPVNEINFKTPVEIDTCRGPSEQQNNYQLFQYDLGSSLKFNKDSEVELEVTYSQAAIDGKILLHMSGFGEESQSKKHHCGMLIWEFSVLLVQLLVKTKLWLCTKLTPLITALSPPHSQPALTTRGLF